MDLAWHNVSDNNNFGISLYPYTSAILRNYRFKSARLGLLSVAGSNRNFRRRNQKVDHPKTRQVDMQPVSLDIKFL